MNQKSVEINTNQNPGYVHGAFGKHRANDSVSMLQAGLCSTRRSLQWLHPVPRTWKAFSRAAK